MEHKDIKWCYIVLTFMMIVFIFSGCSSKNNEPVSEVNNVKAVKSQVIKKESYTSSLDYSGYVAADEAKSFSFETGGKVKEVFVKEGEYVTTGQPLAELDISNIQLEIDNTMENIALMNNSIQQVENNISNLKLSLETKNINLKKTKDSYERIQALYNEGAVSLQDYENSKASYDLAEQELKKAKKDLELANLKLQESHVKLDQAQITLEENRKKLKNSTMISTIEGIVSDVLLKADEMASSGSPVVAVSSKEQIINISVPVDEYIKIQRGAKVSIESLGETFTGVIDKISLYPDEATRTYNVKIIPQKKELVLASIVNVKVPIEQKEGYFIPITSILNINDVNYIYALEKEEDSNYYHIKPREVILGETYGDKVIAKNITSDMRIITEGIKNIKESDIVQIVK